MRNVKRSILAITACALCSAIPLAAANQPAAGKDQKTTKTEAVNKKTTKAKAPKKKMTKTAAVRSAWPPETLSAKIAAVDPDRKLVVLETPDQVTYDMVVNAKTRITSGNQALPLQSLTQDKNKSVSVRFIPERRGDVASSIQISG
jgi:hypothetical protein